MVEGTAAYHIGSRTLAIVYQDLATLEADVLVSSDDNYLSMGGGVSRRLATASGPSVRDHARKFVPPLGGRPLRRGDVVVTTAGGLSALYLFHAITIDFDQGKGPDESIIEQTTVKCMSLAETLGVTSIAFPALGTGAGSFSFRRAADLMIRAITAGLDSSTTLERAMIALFARSGVIHAELDAFYEHAVAQVALWQQTKRLGQSLDGLEAATGLGRTERDGLRRVHAEVQAAEERIAVAPGDDEVESGDRAGSLVDLSRRVEFSLSELSAPGGPTQDPATRQAAGQVELERLRVERNARLLLLTKLQTDRAMVGKGDPDLENRIAAVTEDVNRLYARIEEAERRLTAIA